MSLVLPQTRGPQRLAQGKKADIIEIITGRCRRCGDRRRELDTQGECSSCRQYGEWFGKVSHKSETEITGEVDIAGLERHVSKDRARLVLNPSEARGHRLWRRADFAPQIVSIRPDDVGVGFTLRDKRNEEWTMWRPYRMVIELLVDGVPARLHNPNPDEDEVTEE